MKEICFVNKGDNIRKLSHTIGIPSNSVIEKGRLFNNQYVTLEEGSDDIIAVRNYSPYHLKKLDGNNTLLDIYALGYEIVGGSDNEDVAVIKKISGIRYVVRPMESLDDISNKLGVTKANIIENNNLKTDKLFVGQVLII